MPITCSMVIHALSLRLSGLVRVDRAPRFGRSRATRSSSLARGHCPRRWRQVHAQNEPVIPAARHYGPPVSRVNARCVRKRVRLDACARGATVFVVVAILN